MAFTAYQAAREQIIQEHANPIDIWETDSIAGRFQLISACLQNFLPTIDFKEHPRIFREILLHQQLSILDQFHSEALDELTCESLTPQIWAMLKKGGAVICSFHTGSYRTLNQFLIKNQIPLTLVIANSVMSSQGPLFESLHQLHSNGQEPASFGLIDAESPSSGLQMLKALKKGNNLLIYIDGNTGSGEEGSERNNLIRVNFLSQQILARQGVAFIAHIAKAPILAVLSHRKSLTDLRLQFHDPIWPDACEDRDSFAKRSTQEIYDFASNIIARYPGQWEAWMYLHKFAHIIHCPNTASAQAVGQAISETGLKFNLKEYGIFRIGANGFLLKKAGLESYSIEEPLYHCLHRAHTSCLAPGELDGGLLNELFENSVLVPIT